ncbi:MAG: hypothetical protein IJS52_08715 [Bacilli bacterium]|nr:hypothetical protein [Bacilli bacterium]
MNTLILRENWLIAKRFYEEELKGENRAEYGAKNIASLSKSLTLEFGRGFGKTSLPQLNTFYKLYPNIFHSNGKSSIVIDCRLFSGWLSVCVDYRLMW